MKGKKQVYQNPEMEIHYLAYEDVVTASGGSNLTWNNGWNENEWDNEDNTYIGE